MQSALILPSSGSSRRSAAMVLSNCSVSPPIRMISGCPRVCRRSRCPLRMLKAQILQFDRMIRAWHRSSEASRRLDDIPGVGPALATALVASIADPKVFRSSRDFSAGIGLVPKQNSSGGKDRLCNISKRGDRYLRSLFTAGALAVIRYAKLHGTEHRPWLTMLLARRPRRLPPSHSPTRLPEWHGP
jgi:hypothetical protein